MEREQIEALREKVDSNYLLLVENLDCNGHILPADNSPQPSPDTASIRFTFDDGVQFMLQPLDLIELSLHGITPVILPKNHVH